MVRNFHCNWARTAVFAILLAPVAFADPLTPGKSAAKLPYSVSVNQGAIVLDIVNSLWTNTQINSTWKVTGPTASQLALVKTGLHSLLGVLKFPDADALSQKNVVSLALSDRGWTVYTPPGPVRPGPTVHVPEEPAVLLLGLNMALFLALVIIFRRRILQLS